MKKLEMKKMEMVAGGSWWNLGCAWQGFAAGLATAELGPLSLVIGGATYLGCINKR